MMKSVTVKIIPLCDADIRRTRGVSGHRTPDRGKPLAVRRGLSLMCAGLLSLCADAAKVWDVTDFGAREGDALQTAVLQRAIDACFTAGMTASTCARATTCAWRRASSRRATTASRASTTSAAKCATACSIRPAAPSASAGRTSSSRTAEARDPRPTASVAVCRRRRGAWLSMTARGRRTA